MADITFNEAPLAGLELDEIRKLERLARLMDSAVRVPGTRFSIGLDSIIGLAPGVGDALALLPGAYIIWKAHSLGVPRATLIQMAANAAIDWGIGSIPLLGDIFDAGFKSKIRNVELLKKSLSLGTDQAMRASGNSP